MRPTTNTLPAMPVDPTEKPPADPGLIPLAVAEVKRLYNLFARTMHDAARHLYEINTPTQVSGRPLTHAAASTLVTPGRYHR